MRNPEVQKLLDEKIDDIAGVRCAVVLAEDGLPLYWSGFDEETALRRSPLAASLGNLASRVAAEEGGGAVRRTLIEMEGGFFVVARAGSNTFLAVTTKPDANLGHIGYELTLLTKRLGPVLDAEQRPLPAEGGAPA
ncbi:roadblock/LC7 domain-containing protein [Streptomyces sp. NPDC059740]|uniref:roadblock/LC7 domain-containing protein n=1 Tax=Streptomyces sp. NPDC059740 TaxID=3346926 RepID=UPI00365181DA